MTPHTLEKETADQFLRYEHGELYWKISNSNRVKVGDKITGKNSYGYIRLSINGTRYFAHRVIYLMHHGYMPEIIDHIDMDVTNNRIENLRAATASQNRCNVAQRSDNTSGVKGVSWVKSKDKWTARITKNKRLVLCEEYDDLVSAVIAVRSARLQHHQSFAHHGQ
jgi:hypothetical protein